MKKNQNINIREATKKDIPNIATIHTACVRESNSKDYPKEIIEAWLKEINEENIENQFANSHWSVIEIDSEMVGFAQYCLDDYSLYQLNISPKFQRQGFGRRLYNYIESVFKNAGRNKIMLNATLTSLGLYEKLGFINKGLIDYPLETLTLEMVKMEKVLKYI